MQACLISLCSATVHLRFKTDFNILVARRMVKLVLCAKIERRGWYTLMKWLVYVMYVYANFLLFQFLTLEVYEAFMIFSLWNLSHCWNSGKARIRFFWPTRWESVWKSWGFQSSYLAAMCPTWLLKYLGWLVSQQYTSQTNIFLCNCVQFVMFHHQLHSHRKAKTWLITVAQRDGSGSIFLDGRYSFYTVIFLYCSSPRLRKSWNENSSS